MMYVYKMMPAPIAGSEEKHKCDLKYQNAPHRVDGNIMANHCESSHKHLGREALTLLVHAASESVNITRARTKRWQALQLSELVQALLWPVACVVLAGAHKTLERIC